MSNQIQKKTKHPYILITGASGYIGREFLSEIKHLNYIGIKFNSKLEFVNNNIIKVDLRKGEEVERIFNKYKPHIVYHFAALTSPATNERNTEFAREIHLGITKNILENISEESHIIYLSTDKVFDGTDEDPDEDAAINPLWTYGKFKLNCEKMIKEKMGKFHILRLPIVHSLGSTNSNSFIDKAIIKLKKGEEVKVYDNVFRCYVLSSDLVNILKKMMDDSHYGTYHVGTEMMSYYDRILHMCQKIGIEYTGLIQPIKGSTKPMKQNLNTEKIKRVFGYDFT